MISIKPSSDPAAPYINTAALTDAVQSAVAAALQTHAATHSVPEHRTEDMQLSAALQGILKSLKSIDQKLGTCHREGGAYTIIQQSRNGSTCTGAYLLHAHVLLMACVSSGYMCRVHVCR